MDYVGFVRFILSVKGRYDLDYVFERMFIVVGCKMFCKGVGLEVRSLIRIILLWFG